MLDEAEPLLDAFLGDLDVVEDVGLYDLVEDSRAWRGGRCASTSTARARDGDSQRVLETLIKLPNIIVATRTVGDHDLLALGVIFGVGHLVELSGEIGGIPGVRDLQVSIWETGSEVSPKFFFI